MSRLTQDEVIDRMVHMSRDDLYEIVYGAYKDQYGTRPTHMSDWSVPDLVSWYIIHYEWNEQHQMWESAIPFEEVA